MDDEEARTIGQRLRMIRRRRGLGLTVAAGLAGISKPYLSMLERGERGFNRRGLIEDLAEALSCSVADLTGRPYVGTDRGTAAVLATVPAISLAINDCTLDDVPDMPARPVEQLVAAAAQANAYLDAASFSLAGNDAARRLNDSTRVGLLTMHHSLGLHWIGARHRVMTVLDEALAEIRPDPSVTDTGPAQATGMMHLTAAMHHARQGRGGQANDHLSHAEELARRTGERNALLQHFGPVNVTTWGVNVAVELGRGPVVAEGVEPHVPRLLDTFGSAVRGGALHFDLARAYAQAEGARDAEAIRHLDAADRLAPQYVRPDPMARELVLTLDRRATRRVWELDSLRNRFGVSDSHSRSVNS
ncbi:MAG: helix-turn-helix transcriptional regulator [Actinobacteria bacterium]|nr:helix-turn-helix transcriptional regulator [Actinomycetota bacterium]